VRSTSGQYLVPAGRVKAKLAALVASPALTRPAVPRSGATGHRRWVGQPARRPRTPGGHGTSYIGPWYGPVYPRPVELSEKDERELREERAAIEREAAKLRELYDALDDDEADDA
jgi:hypothetical protein